MDKLQAYLKSELDALREKGIFNRPRVLESEQKSTVIIDGHEVITLSSNNYLGLTVHPRLREAAIKSIEKYGVGSGSFHTYRSVAHFTVRVCDQSGCHLCCHAGRRFNHQR